MSPFLSMYTIFVHFGHPGRVPGSDIDPVSFGFPEGPPPPPFEIGTHEDGRARARTRARIPRQVFAFVPPYANSTKLRLSPTNYNGNPESVRKGAPT